MSRYFSNNAEPHHIFYSKKRIFYLRFIKNAFILNNFKQL